MLNPSFANYEIYHIYNRGVEKRKVFLNDKDYLRFIHDLFEFNDIRPVPPANIRFHNDHPGGISALDIKQSLEVEPLRIDARDRKPRELLVELMAFCLMPNHYHLLIRQLRDEGVTKFMQKLGTGYTMYFNKKNERVGPLFQGKFKAVHLTSDSHYLHIPHYIHLNPLDLLAPSWREGKLPNRRQAKKFLESYRWSSFLDFIGIKNFPSVTQRDFLAEILGTPAKYRSATLQLLQEMDMENIRAETLE